MSNAIEREDECLICRKQRGEFSVPGGAIYSDDLVYSSHAHFQEGQALGLLAARLSRLLRLLLGAEHVYAFAIGHGVPHFHMHLLPRYPGTPREYWGMRIDEWPDAPRGGRPEIEQLCARIRATLDEINRESVLRLG